MPIRRGLLLAIFLAGCVSPEPSRSGVDWQSLKVDVDPGPDRVLFDVAMVQRPLGDAFLNDGLWSGADEMIVPADLRDLLDLNGYRIGLLVGSPPDALAALLQSDRSCLERKGRSTPSGAPLAQTLRDCRESVDAFLHVGRQRESLALDRPLFALDLVPTLQPDRSVRLKLAPRVETGEKAMNYKPVPEESKWALEVKRPTRVLSDLAAEIAIPPEQILIVGPRLDRPGSIGEASFVDDQGDRPMQRLLILRHVRSRTATARNAGEIPYHAVSRVAP